MSSNTDLFGSLVHTEYRYSKRLHNIILTHTHTYNTIAKSSADMDCELEILYNSTAYVYVELLGTMILTLNT